MLTASTSHPHAIDFPVTKLSLHLIFLYLAVLSIYFHVERATYIDSAHHLFLMIQNEGFAVLHSRYSMVLYQWLPLLGIKMHLSLRTVCILFSMSMIVWSYLVFIYARRFLKDSNADLGIILLLTILPRHSFFSVYEMSGGIVLLPLLFGHLSHLSSERWSVHIVAASLLALAIVFFHSALSIAILFTVGIWFLTNHSSTLRRRLTVLLSMTVSAVAWFIINPLDYESRSFAKLPEMVASISDFQLYKMFSRFFDSLLSDYLVFLCFTVAVVVMAAVRRKWTVVGMLIFSFVAYPLLIYTLRRDSLSLSLNEIRNLPLSVFVVLSFLTLIGTKNHVRQHSLILYTLVSVGVLVSLIQIPLTGPKYDQILKYKTDILNYCSKFPENSFVWNASHVNRNQIELTWAFSEETLLLSSINSRSSKTIYILDHRNPVNVDAIDSSSVIVATGVRPAAIKRNKLNSFYFYLSPSEYKWLNYSLRTPDLQAAGDSTRAITLSIVDFQPDKGLFSIKILNRDSKPLYSHANSTPRTLIWYNISDATKSFTKRVPLEVDITDEYVQQINTETLASNSRQKLVVDLYSPGRGRWRIEDWKVLLPGTTED